MSAQRTAGGRRLAHIKRHWQLYLLLLPGIIYILVFKYWPMAGIQIAFKDFKPLKGIWGSPWATSKGSLDLLKHFERFLGSKYSRNMGLMLVMLTLITTPVVMCIKSSLELSMGMVGALSIVRFRTAVKDPLDTAYMFWALTMGILLGAGYFLIAVIVAIAIALLIFVLNSVKIKKEDSYLLVMHYDDYAEQAIERVLRTQHFRHLKSKTVTRMGVEMTVELRVDANNTSKLINTLLDQEGVHDATLVAYQNEAG